MRALVKALILIIAAAVHAEDGLRVGTPKDCFLFSSGKGPNWIAKISTEFQLSLLNRQMPYVDDRYFEPTDKALSWPERLKEPNTTTIASVDGRQVIQVVYPEDGAFGKTIGTILLAIETTRGSGWFAPFFAAQPELYRGKFVSSRDVKFGYVATLEFSGTGAFRTHYLFDLHRPHPMIVATVNAGRVVRNEFKTDLEFEEANTVFVREDEILSGTIPKAPSTKPAKK